MPGDQFEVQLSIGDSMQWQAAVGSHLTAYEICFPPYKEGRYEDIKQPDQK
jgi:hypothetical protein